MSDTVIQIPVDWETHKELTRVKNRAVSGFKEMLLAGKQVMVDKVDNLKKSYGIVGYFTAYLTFWTHHHKDDVNFKRPTKLSLYSRDFSNSQYEIQIISGEFTHKGKSLKIKYRIFKGGEILECLGNVPSRNVPDEIIEILQLTRESK